jgi:putative transposase
MKLLRRGLCHEEEVYGGADCVCFETGGAWDFGGRSYQEDGNHRADLLPLKKKYGGLGMSELRRLKQLEEENRKLKQMVADLSLDKHMLQEVLTKKF